MRVSGGARLAVAPEAPHLDLDEFRCYFKSRHPWIVYAGHRLGILKPADTALSLRKT
jgi:hypothetical protein